MGHHGEARESVQPLLGIKPPLVLIALITIGIAIHFIAPAQLLPDGGIQFVGIPVVLVGLAFALSANLSFHRVGTDDRFASPTSTIVQAGAFSLSRNPMYLGMVLITLGVVISIDSAWSLLVLPVLIIYLQIGVIQREEEYLERWFGQQYRDYRSKVRRWL